MYFIEGHVENQSSDKYIVNIGQPIWPETVKFKIGEKNNSITQFALILPITINFGVKSNV